MTLTGRYLSSALRCIRYTYYGEWPYLQLNSTWLTNDELGNEGWLKLSLPTSRPWIYQQIFQAPLPSEAALLWRYVRLVAGVTHRLWSTCKGTTSTAPLAMRSEVLPTNSTFRVSMVSRLWLSMLYLYMHAEHSYSRQGVERHRSEMINIHYVHSWYLELFIFIINVYNN